jgi:hypothetical protein
LASAASGIDLISDIRSAVDDEVFVALTTRFPDRVDNRVGV